MAFETLGIGIKVDPADSAGKADQVTAALHKTEDQGIAAGKAMLGLAGNFKSLAQAIQQHQAALERTNVAHRHLTSALPAAAAGFSKLAEAMQREQQMLDRIHGPARRYAEDLQVLDALLHRNAISTAEYASQVTRLNREIDGAPRAANSNVPTATPGPNILGSLRGTAAAVGVTLGASQIGGMVNEFQSLENRLRYLAGGDLEKVNQLFGQLQGVASRTRGDLSATTEAFVRMSLATKQMGLSSDETLQLTERLNKAIALSGASGAEAAAGMIQLSQGLASGALRGDELRSVMEQLPAVADVIAQGLGVTRGQLRQMGADGKITAEVIVDSFRKAGTSLDRDFGNTVPTISQSLTAFKNEMIVAFGEFDKATGISQAFGDSLRVLGGAVQVAIAPIRLLYAALDQVGISGGVATEVLGAMGVASYLLGGPAGILVGVGVAALHVADALGDWQEEMNKARLVQEQFAVAQHKAREAVSQGTEAVRLAHKEMVELSLRTMLGAEAADAFTAAWIKADAAARSSHFRDLFMKGDDIDQFGRLASGGFGPKNEIDQFNTFLSRNSRATDEAAVAAAGLIAEREKSVTAATKELAALERVWESYDHGGYTIDLYAQQKQRLLTIINGTTAAHKKEADEAERLARALLGVESASQRAIRMGAASRNAGQAEDSFIAGLDHRTGFDATKRYRAERAQLADLHNRKRVDDELYARGIGEINARYTESLGLTNLLKGKSDEHKQSLENLETALANGAISAAQFNHASRKLWMGTDEYKAEEELFKKREEAEAQLVEKSKQHAEQMREAWARSAGSIAGSFFEMAKTGEFSLGKLLDQATQMALQMAALHIGGPGGAFLSSFAGAIGGGANGFDHVVGGRGRLELPGFATGGNVTVGGTGGTDSKIAMFRVTPGESIHVRTPQQQAAEAAWRADQFRVRAGESRDSAPSAAAPAPHAMSSNDVDRIVAAIERGMNPTIVVEDDIDAMTRHLAGYRGQNLMTKMRRNGSRAAR